MTRTMEVKVALGVGSNWGIGRPAARQGGEVVGCCDVTSQEEAKFSIHRV